MTRSISDKKSVRLLTDMCQAEGIAHVILSPGSRNAPLILSFTGNTFFKCNVVVDERSAGFIALGMAQQTGKPVALVCTSGTAVLNYAPAIAEAYYQNIPLVVITADRPGEWIDQSDGQTIRQHQIYGNYVRYSCTLPVDFFTDAEEWHATRLISEALMHCKSWPRGPVHINVPLREPLYGKAIHSPKNIRPVSLSQSLTTLTDVDAFDMAKVWKSAERVMIITGMRNPDSRLRKILNELGSRERVVILTETISNCHGNEFIRCIDRVLASIQEGETGDFSPELLITIDGAVISKMVKTFLRKNPPKEHWHLSEAGQLTDTYQHLSRIVQGDPVRVLEQVASMVEDVKGSYRHVWQNRAERVALIHEDFIKSIPWCDLKVFSCVFGQLRDGMVLQLGNSTPVRYAQLFDVFSEIESFANRGTSGIDGCVSTAVGAAMVRNEKVVAIVGDLSFFYDSNALWNNCLSDNLKVIIVNNGGGGIFRFLPGSSETEELEDYFAVGHAMNAQFLAMQFNVGYSRCEDEQSLVDLLPVFIDSAGPFILEVMTPIKDNARILKAYFSALKK